MAITGKFIADMSQFDSAMQASGAKLRTFEGDATKAGTSIKGMETSARTSTSMLSSMGAQLAGMFTVGAVVAFGRSVLNTADAIQKMADQTGLSTVEVQKLQHIAGQSGTAIGSLVSAVQNLQQRLGDHDAGAVGAMAKLGIQAEAFNRLNTYQQMTTLADAVRGVKDPTDRASLAADLFGKTWKEILPAIMAGMKGVGDAAVTMSDGTVKSLDRVGDALARASQGITSWAGTGAANFIESFEKMQGSVGDFLTKFDPSHWGIANSQLLSMQVKAAQLEGQLVTAKPPALALGEAAKGMGMSFEAASAMAKQLDLEVNASIKTNTAVKEAVDATAKSVRDYYNWVGERALEHEKTIQDSLAREAAAYRAFSNEIGVRRQEDDARAIAGAEAAAKAEDALGQSLMDEATAEHAARVARAQANTELTHVPPLAAAASASVNDLANVLNAAAGVIVGNQRLEQAYNAAGIGQNNYFLSGIMAKPIQQFAAGGPVLRDGPIYAHAGEYVLPKGGAGGVTIVVNGSLLSTKAELARLIKDALANAHMSGGGRMPA